MFTESDNTDMSSSSAASTATNGSTCTVIELNPPSIVNNQTIPNSSCNSSNVNSIINNHQHHQNQKLQPQTESKDTDYYLKLAQVPSSSSGMKLQQKTLNTGEIASKDKMIHRTHHPHLLIYIYIFLI